MGAEKRSRNHGLGLAWARSRRSPACRRKPCPFRLRGRLPPIRSLFPRLLLDAAREDRASITEADTARSDRRCGRLVCGVQRGRNSRCWLKKCRWATASVTRRASAAKWILKWRSIWQQLAAHWLAASTRKSRSSELFAAVDGHSPSRFDSFRSISIIKSLPPNKRTPSSKRHEDASAWLSWCHLSWQVKCLLACVGYT